MRRIQSEVIAALLFLLIFSNGFFLIAANASEHNESSPLLLSIIPELSAYRAFCLFEAYGKTGYLPEEPTVTRMRPKDRYLPHVVKTVFTFIRSGIVIPFDLPSGAGDQDYLAFYAACMRRNGYAMGNFSNQ